MLGPIGSRGRRGSPKDSPPPLSTLPCQKEKGLPSRGKGAPLWGADPTDPPPSSGPPFLRGGEKIWELNHLSTRKRKSTEIPKVVRTKMGKFIEQRG